MKRHVLLICDSYPPEIRSSALITQGLARGLRSLGWHVTVLTTYNLFKPEGTFYKREPDTCVFRCPSLPLHGVSLVPKGLAWLLLPFSTVTCGLLIERPDIIWVYSPPLTLALAGAALSALYRCPLVLNVQDLFPENAVRLGLMRKGSLVERAFRAIETISYAKADCLVVHSEGHRAWLSDHEAIGHRKKVRVIPNFADIKALEAATPDPKLKARLGLEGRFCFLFGGVMGYAQGLETVLEAARILSHREDIGFVLVGSGVERKRLERMAKGLTNVVFHDFVEPEEFSRWLKTLDAGLVVLSQRMTTPVVPSKLITFMASGLPVVACVPKESDARSLILKAKCGIWTPAGDPQSLAKACEAMAKDPSLALAAGRRGKEYAKENFSLEKVTAMVSGLLEELTKLKRRG